MQIKAICILSTGSRILRSRVLLNALPCTTRGPISVYARRIWMETSNDASGNKRGALIVLEGLDRSGKSSQCTKLASYLGSEGFPVEAWRFPDRTTEVGKMTSAYLSSKSDLDDRTIHLLFSANRWEKRSLMENKLNSGTSLIVDRYSYSGVAFSAAKGLDLSWCKAPEVGLPAPDLVLYLDIPPEKAAERGGYGEERYEHLDFQRKVAKLYKSLQDSTWQIIDASLPIEDVYDVLKELSLNLLVIAKEERKFPVCGLHRANGRYFLSELQGDSLFFCEEMVVLDENRSSPPDISSIIMN